MGKIIVFIVGAVIGSFLNVCIYRLPRKESIIFPASRCPNCKKNILWYDNIPIVSYLLLLGRCRFCREKVSLRYLLVEVMTAMILLLLFVAFGPGVKFFAYSIFSCSLIVATFIDFEINEIPDEISLGGLILGLALSFTFPQLFDTFGRWPAISNSVVGAIVGGGTIYLMGFFGELIFKREAMGGGDVKLMAMIGSFLGWKLALVTFFLAPIFGSISGIILKLKDGRDIIPYGPYLSLAALLSIFFGNRILSLFFGTIY